MEKLNPRNWKKWQQLFAMILLILSIWKMYLELQLKELPKASPKQINYIKCLKLRDLCNRHTQSLPGSDGFTFICDRIEEICKQGCN